MKRIFILLIITIMSSCFPSFAEDYLIDNINLRPQKSLYLPKGSFIKVTNVKEFVSQYTDAGDEIIMTSTFDVYLGETNLIPQKTVFYGTVEKVREPVQGTNAAIYIKMNKMVTPDGITYPISGYISANGTQNYLGGERTAPLYYVRMPHYTHWKMNRWKIGAAQYCETNTRNFGEHITVKPGAELILTLDENLEL